MRDGEARVVSIQGVYYTCKLPNKQQFVAKYKAGKGAPEIVSGDVIIFKCLSMSSTGLPKQAVICHKKGECMRGM